jgi:hypothetical protein
MCSTITDDLITSFYSEAFVKIAEMERTSEEEMAAKLLIYSATKAVEQAAASVLAKAKLPAEIEVSRLFSTFYRKFTAVASSAAVEDTFVTATDSVAKATTTKSNRKRREKRQCVEVANAKRAEETAKTTTTVVVNIDSDVKEVKKAAANEDDIIKDTTYVNKVEVKSPVGFSEDPIGTLKERLGFTIDDDFYRNLRQFVIEKLPDCNDIDLDSAAKQVNRTIADSVKVSELDEIGRYPFITPILTAVVESCKDIKYHSLRPLREGAVVCDKPNWTLIYEDFPIFIVREKVTIDSSAIAQTVLQIYEAYMKIRPVDSHNDHEFPEPKGQPSVSRLRKKSKVTPYEHSSVIEYRIIMHRMIHK